MATLPFTHKAIAGFQIVYTVTVVDANGNPIAFTGTEPLAATVWSGGQQVSLFAPLVQWNQAPSGTIDITYSAANTQGLAIGFYEVLISRTDVTIALSEGYLEIVPAPGTATTDLCTIPFARMSLAAYTFTLAQLDFLPYAISVVSQAVKRYCGDNQFFQQTYTEEYDIFLDGTITLRQLPVNWIQRIQATPTTALTIQNTLSGATDAWVYFTQTGDDVNGLVVTGMTLNVIVGGVQTTTAVVFTANETIASFAAAINATGNGWNAIPDATYGAWPVTELINTNLPGGPITGSGATFDVYSDDLGSDARLDTLGAGVVLVGRQYRASGPKWGPDWMEFDSPEMRAGRVKVTYNAGWSALPKDLQWAVADLAKRLSVIAALDPTVAAESIEQFAKSYRQIIDLMTPAHRQVLAQYRIHHA